MRVAVHRKVAEAIEAAYAGTLADHLPALTHHWARASAPAADAARAVYYATRTGDRALALLAHDEAAAYYRQALELLDAAGIPADDRRRLELLISLGEGQRRAGDRAHRETLLGAAHLAQGRGDADALARAALANYRGWFSATGTVDAERVAVLEAALHAIGPGGSPLRARLLANLAVELHFSGEDSRRRALSDEALTIARRGGDPFTLAHVLLARCGAIWEPSTVHERLANTAELLSVADRLGDPAIVVYTWMWRFIAATDLADLEEADRSLGNITTLAAELRQPLLLWMASYARVPRLLLAGRLTDGEKAALEARELGRAAGQPDARLYFGTQRYQIRFEQGRLSELVDRLSQALEQNGGATTRALLALAHCELDRDNDARRVFEPLATNVTELPLNVEWLQIVTVSAIVCTHLRNRSLAARLLDLLAPYSDQLVGHGVVWWGNVSHHLGLLATILERFDEAETRFAAAETVHERIGAPTWLARTRLEWARMLLTRRQAGDAERARALLGEALATARELGLANIERRAVPLLLECTPLTKEIE